MEDMNKAVETLDVEAAAAATAVKMPEDITLGQLSEKDQQAVRDYAEKIDVSNASEVLQYGAAAQQKLTVFADTALSNARTKDTGDAQCDALLKEAREALAAIRKTDDGIADEGVSQCIREIDQICRQILLKLEEQPELYSQLRTFLRYYLPTTRKILDNRALIEQRGTMDDENARAVCERTDRLLPEIRRAFQKQLDALNEHNYLDVEVEMDVLEGMMKGDGLAGGASAAATQTK